MSVSAVASSQTGGATWTQRTQHGGGAAMRKAFDAAADALGMSASDLKSALTGGQTMSSLAGSKGISTDTLKSTIASALQGGDSSMTTDRAGELAQKIVDGPQGIQASGAGGRAGGVGGVGGPGGPGGPPPGPPPGGGTGGGPSPDQVDSALSAIAEALGTDEDTLTSQLANGTSLTDIASAGGMTAEQLTSTITSALQEADSALSAEDAADLAQKIVDGPPKPPTDQYTRLALDFRTGAAAGSTATSWESRRSQVESAYTRFASTGGGSGSALSAVA